MVTKVWSEKKVDLSVWTRVGSNQVCGFEVRDFWRVWVSLSLVFGRVLSLIFLGLGLSLGSGEL